MSHYTLDELIARWNREELTLEQMMGQLLQALRAQDQRLREVERRVPPLPSPAPKVETRARRA